MYRYLLLIFLAVCGFAGDLKLPVDDQFIQGTLPNGLTYYIRENHYPKDKASVRLVVKVGSVHEEDDEQGVAHFLEHLVMGRETKHFKDEEIPKYLESVGAWSGPDTNAFTSFESTQYMFEIPIDNPAVLDKVLLMCSDIAADATLSDAGIHTERTIVLDELHQDESDPVTHFRHQVIASAMPGSLYAKRFPIGTEEVVSSITPEQVRAFYRRWYRPDRMALVVVGDFHARTVERKIERQFAWIPRPEEPVVEPELNVRPIDRPQALLYSQPGLDQTSILLIAYSQPTEAKDPLDKQIQDGLLSHAVVDLFRTRLEKRTTEGSEFLGAYAGQGQFSGHTDYFLVGVGLFEARVEEGIRALHEELQQVLSNGFHASEWDVFAQEYEEYLQQSLANLDRIEHSEYVSDCVEHFLTGTPLIPKRWWYEYGLRTLHRCTVSDVNGYIPQSSLTKPCLAAFSSPKKQIANEQTLLDFFDPPSTAQQLLNYLSNSSIAKWFSGTTSTFSGEPQFPPGRIVHSQEQAGYLVWTLSNGMRVYVKQTDLVHGEVKVWGWAKGGLAAFPPEDFHSAAAASSYMSLLDSSHDADQLLRSKSVAAGCDMGLNNRYLHSTGPAANLEFQLQLLHAIFTNPRFNPTAWDRLVHVIQEDQAQTKNNPAELFHQFVQDTNTGSHLFFQPTDVNQLHEARARSAFLQAFGSPQEFTFAIAGDFDRHELARLVEKYMASLPASKNPPLRFSPTPPLFPKQTIQKEFKGGAATYADVRLTMPFNPTALPPYTTEALDKILQQRLMDKLRIQLGQTYGVWVRARRPLFPDLTQGTVQIGWTCAPAHARSMVRIVQQEIEKLRVTPPSAEEVSTVQALLLEGVKNSQRTNSYWTNVVWYADLVGTPLEEELADEARIQALTPNILLHAAQDLFSSPYSSVLTHLPKD